MTKFRAIIQPPVSAEMEKEFIHAAIRSQCSQ